MGFFSINIFKFFRILLDLSGIHFKSTKDKMLKIKKELNPLNFSKIIGSS